MKRIDMAVLAAACVAALGGACSRSEGTTSTTQTTSATVGDRDFVTRSARRDMLEVALARETARKATSPDVRKLAGQMVDERGRAETELERVAKSKGIAAPDELAAKDKTTVDGYLLARGPDIDAMYVHETRLDLARDVSDLREAASQLHDPDLRAYAEKLVPIYTTELAKARAVEASTNR